VIKIATLFLFLYMSFRTTLLVSVLFFLAFLIDSQAQTLITSVNVIDVSSGEVIPDQDVLIMGHHIARISDLIAKDPTYHIIDGQDQWLIPGLVDAHIHMFQSGGLYTRPDALDLRDIRPYQEEIDWLYTHATDILDSYLNLGITSAFRISDPPIIKANTPEEARALVKMQLDDRPDFIKIWYINAPGITPSNHIDIVRAVIEESHAHDIPVAVHATDMLTAKISVQEGADILVHSVAQPMDSEIIEMIVDQQVVLIPTLVVHGGYDKAFLGEADITSHDLDNGIPLPISDLLDQSHIDHPNLEEAKTYAPEFIATNDIRDSIRTSNLRRLIAAGAIISTGTDAGNIGTFHATSYLSELRAMKAAGISDSDILKASTMSGAIAMGKALSHGQVKEGFEADLILLRSNPLENIEHLADISSVIKDGKVIDREKLSLRSPEELVQMQLNAYNMGNIESFLLPYSDSVKVYNFPDELSLIAWSLVIRSSIMNV